jgi:hypothetical protein
MLDGESPKMSKQTNKQAFEAGLSFQTPLAICVRGRIASIVTCARGFAKEQADCKHV